jgi:hypothetical protein
MATPTKFAAIVTAAVLAVTPATAMAAKKHHPSPAKTCAALKKKEGVKAFDAKFGTGPKHKHAMARCVKLHSAKKTAKKH